MSVIAEIHKDLEHGVIRMIAEYRDRLMAEALRLCHDESTAEDLVSSTFSKAIRNFDSYKVDDNFFGWLKTIMVNAYRSDLRNPVTRGTTPTDPDVLATDESLVTNETEDRILKDSDHDALREAVGRLPPIYRRAVVLHYFEEFSIKDVAIALHAPVGTIFRRLNVARKLLAKDLAVKLGKKKPLVILLALLFGAGALFGAWQAGVSIVEAMSEGGEAVSTNPPTIEDNQPTLTTADPDEPVMTYPTFSSTTATTEKEVNKQEESIMTTIKKTLLAAVSAVSLMSAGSADAYQDLKTYLMPSGATATDTDNGFKYAYTANDTTYYVEVFAKTGSTTWTVPDGVAAIDYLVVGGGGAGGSSTNVGSGGGGGAGGMLASSEPIVVAEGSEISILVGAGGIGVAKANGKPGENSVLTIPTLSPITAKGGGYGGKAQTAGGSGGSGGGGGAYQFASSGLGGAGGMGDSAQGCDGGTAGKNYGGCGGGAGAAGGRGAAGAVGRRCAITGKDVIFAGGGGCGGNTARNFNSWGSGGSDIGGSGGCTTAGEERGAAGMDGTGSGGGGNGINCTDAGGKGGDGIVIIRYLAPSKDNVTVAHAGEVAYGAALLNPTYGDYAIGDYATYTAPTFAETETAGVRAYCLGWQLLDKYDLPSGELNPSTTATPEYTDGGYTVQWNWELRYTVAATPTGSGSVSGAGDYVEGATVTLVATADEDSRFVEWSWDATKLDAKADGETLTFTMIAEPVEITAKFDKKLATGVTVAFEGGNYGTPSPAYGTYAGYADGTERTYSMAETVIGEGGEKIYLVGWKLQDGEGELVRDSDTGLGPDESISLVKFTCGTDEAFTLVWRWEPRYTLTAVANPAEGGTVTGAGDYAAGATVTLTANVIGGYKLTGWEGAPEDATEDGSTLTFTMPAVPTTVTANFEMVPWGITVVSGETTEDHRDKCEPGTDYEFQSPLYYNVQEGVSRKHCLGYTLTPMREDGEESELKEAKLEGETLTATVTYEEPVKLTWKWADDYYFTLAQDGEGTVTGPAEGWYASGTEFTLTAAPAKNYEFLCWMGSVSGTDTTVSVTITAKTSVKALFSPVQQVKSDWEAIEGKPAMMRTVKSLGKTYCVVKFTDSTTYEIPKKVTSIDCLVVGGGGGGAGTRGGGGGAGGFNYQTGLAVTPGEKLTVTVGAGGVGSTQRGNGGSGGDSALSGGQTITAHGGGYGAYETNKPGEGASGGGVGGNNYGSYSEQKGGAKTAEPPEQGNPGGDRTDTTKQKCGAGGGGAGGKGGDVGKGKGGDGLPSTITGETVWYAAGGPGGTSSPYATDKYADAAANTGNGGTGGKAENKVTDAGFAGGSGVVIIRYALPSQGAMILIF